jgi:hypothetical protein
MASLAKEENAVSNTAEHGDNDGQPNNQPAAAADKNAPVQFNPITLTSSEEDSDSDDEELHAKKKSANARAVLPISKIPLNENAIQECFLMAVRSHNNEHQEEWHWNENKKIDSKAEEEMLRSWVPRPMFLPTWAVQGEDALEATP